MKYTNKTRFNERKKNMNKMIFTSSVDLYLVSLHFDQLHNSRKKRFIKHITKGITLENKTKQNKNKNNNKKKLNRYLTDQVLSNKTNSLTCFQTDTILLIQSNDTLR